MNRRAFAFVLLALALLLVIGAPLLFFTPVGKTLLLGPPTPTPRPILTARGTPPELSSPVALLMDASNGNVLVNVEGQKRVPMASTTKIMTAILAIEKGKLDEIVTIKENAVEEVKKFNGSSAQLVVGDKIRLKDLLYALMLPSGDDSAIAIAEAVGGSTANFVKMMNDHALKLGLKQTRFINSSGLTYLTPDGKPDPNHYTTAEDLARLTRYALSNPFFAQIVQLQRYELAPTADRHAYTWETTNTLLSFYPGATGVKTGFTEEAGYCLVFSARSAIGGHHLVGVVMQGADANQRFVDARKLLDWGLALPLLLPPAPKE